MLDKIKSWFKPKPGQVKSGKSEKEIATENNQPWVNIDSIDLDPTNPRIGAMDLDWNPQFIQMLKKNGFPNLPDEQVIDIWLTDLCKQIAMETYENANATELGYPGMNVEELEKGRRGYS